MRHPRPRPVTAIVGLSTALLLACGGGGDDGGGGITPPDNAAPSASISGPDDEANFDEGAAVTFEGSASDPEDGDLSGGSLVWTSDLDGEIGTGASVSASGLSVGHHVVTLTATDSDGATATEQIGVRVRTPDQAVTVDLDIGDNFFEDLQGRRNEQAYVRVRVGDTVRWTNNGAVSHTVTSGEGSGGNDGDGVPAGASTGMSSGTLGAGGDYSFQFGTAGVWTYYCEVHPGVMIEATVEVVPQP